MQRKETKGFDSADFYCGDWDHDLKINDPFYFRVIAHFFNSVVFLWFDVEYSLMQHLILLMVSLNSAYSLL